MLPNEDRRKGRLQKRYESEKGQLTLRKMKKNRVNPFTIESDPNFALSFCVERHFAEDVIFLHVFSGTEVAVCQAWSIRISKHIIKDLCVAAALVSLVTLGPCLSYDRLSSSRTSDGDFTCVWLVRSPKAFHGRNPSASRPRYCGINIPL